MKKESVTLEYLQKKVWWWRKPEKLSGFVNKSPNLIIDSPGELAWFYELIIRANRDQDFPGYESLSFTESFFLSKHFGENFQVVTRDAATPEHENEPGWTPFVGKRQWNLNASDNLLVKNFLIYIHGCRSTQKIASPKRNEGRKRRGLAWRWPELMDKEYYGLGSFDDGEKTALRSAKNKAKGLSKEFFGLLRMERAGNKHASFEQYFKIYQPIFGNVLLPK